MIVVGLNNRDSQILSEMAESPKLTTNSIKLGHGEVAKRQAGELLMEMVAMECGSLRNLYILHPAALTRGTIPGPALTTDTEP